MPALSSSAMFSQFHPWRQSMIRKSGPRFSGGSRTNETSTRDSEGSSIDARHVFRGSGDRAGDDAAAEYARLTVGGVIEHTGLAGRHAVLAVDQFDFNFTCGTRAQPRGLRRAGRAHLHEDFGAMRQRRVEGAVAEPIDLAQPDTAGAQRLARTDHDAARGGVEPHHIKRRAGGDTEAAALADG